MSVPIFLASASQIRHQMLLNAGVVVQAVPTRLDETAITDSLRAEGAGPRDIADTLAEMKAEKLARKQPGAVVIGADQVLAFDGALLEKPQGQDEARAQLQRLSGQTHRLISAVVVYHAGEPVWRHAAVAKLTMRPLTAAYIDSYVARNWPAISHCVGAYQLESEGARLFAAIEGDYFTVLGLPLLPLLGYLAQRGWIDG